MISVEYILENVEKHAKPNSRLLLQIPEGLKTRAVEIAEALEKSGYIVIISNDPCYGACDIRDREAQLLGCDYIVHLGHKKFYKNFNTTMPVIYIPIELEAKWSEEELENIEENKICIFSTVQYSHALPKLSEQLIKLNKEVITGGEILGCMNENVKSKESSVDAFLFLGTGKFHPTGLKTTKNVYIIDLETGRLEVLDKSEMEKQQRIIIAKKEKLKDAKTIGILISSKQGQFYQDYYKIKQSFEREGKKVFVLVMDYITNDKLMGLKIDFFINTACPRIAEDVFDKPVINARDLD